MIGRNMHSMGEQKLESGDRAGIRTLDLLIKRTTLCSAKTVADIDFDYRKNSQSNFYPFSKRRRNPLRFCADWERFLDLRVSVSEADHCPLTGSQGYLHQIESEAQSGTVDDTKTSNPIN